VLGGYVNGRNPQAALTAASNERSPDTFLSRMLLKAIFSIMLKAQNAQEVGVSPLLKTPAGSFDSWSSQEASQLFAAK